DVGGLHRQRRDLHGGRAGLGLGHPRQPPDPAAECRQHGQRDPRPQRYPADVALAAIAVTGRGVIWRLTYQRSSPESLGCTGTTRENVSALLPVYQAADEDPVRSTKITRRYDATSLRAQDVE